MPGPILDHIQVDVVTWILLGLGAVVLVIGYSLRPASPACHPFLLGRQAITARTRNVGESPVYTNASTGGIRSPVRPDKKFKLLQDITSTSLSTLEIANPTSTQWIQPGDKIGDLVNALRLAFDSKLGSTPVDVAVLVQDPATSLLLTLALATSRHKLVVIPLQSAIPTDLPAFQAVIYSTDALDSVNKLETSTDVYKLVLDDEQGHVSSDAGELLELGRQLVKDGGETASGLQAEPSDVALTMVSEGIALQFTHLNLTSALVTWLGVFPTSPKSTKPAIKDHIMSFHHPSTPYGLGLALFVMLNSSALSLPSVSLATTPESIETLFLSKSAPFASMIFAPSDVLADSLYKLILTKMLGDSQAIITHSLNGKRHLSRHGVISQNSVYDNVLFGSVRRDIGIGRVRALVLSSPSLLPQARAETFRVVMGVPCVQTFAHAFLLAPVTHAMMYDFQRLPHPEATEVDPTQVQHVGPPSVGVELKLRGKESEIEKGHMHGEVLVRSPMLPAPATLPSVLIQRDVTLPQLPPYPGSAASADDKALSWLRTGYKAVMSPEGTLWLDEEDK